MIVAVDLDDVVRDLIGNTIKVYNREYPSHKMELSKIIQWDLSKFFPIGDKIYNFMFKKFAEEIYLTAPIMKNAKEGLKYLNSLSFVSDVFILTQPPNGLKHLAYEWIGKSKIDIDKVVIVYPGDRINKNGYNFDILIDDAPKHLEAILDTNKIPICFDRPWNQEWGGMRTLSWTALMGKFSYMSTISKVG